MQCVKLEADAVIDCYGLGKLTCIPHRLHRHGLYLSRLKAVTPHDKVAAKDEYNVRKNKSKLSEHRPFHSIWDTISEI